MALPAIVSRCPGPEIEIDRRGVIAEARIPVHRAAWYEWALLDGIGEARARRIVEFVREHRPLRDLAQLEDIPGLPGGWVERSRHLLELDPLPDGEAVTPAAGSLDSEGRGSR